MTCDLLRLAVDRPSLAGESMGLIISSALLVVNDKSVYHKWLISQTPQLGVKQLINSRFFISSATCLYSTIGVNIENGGSYILNLRDFSTVGS